MELESQPQVVLSYWTGGVSRGLPLAVFAMVLGLLEAQELDHLHHGPHDDQEELLDDEERMLLQQ